MTATILVADRPTLERLLLEGGLRSSFIAIFGGSLFDTADDTPRGDGDGIDDLLERRRIVCIDRALLAPIDDSLPDRPERERYRHNLARKLAARQHAWLRVIEDAGEAQAGALRSLASQLREASRHAGAGAVRRTLVILVFTKEMEPESREIVREIRDDVPGVARVYLMAHRLQPADRGSRAITAHAVWPVCVARLLAVRSILGAHEQGKPEIAVWRTLEWGGGRGSDEAAAYRAMLRERLMPADDPEGRDVQDALARVFLEKEGTVDASPENRSPLGFRWEMPAEDLSAAGFGSVADRVFESVLRGSGERSLDGRALQRGIDRADGVARQVASRWGDVAHEKDGLRQLRRLADGRGWPVRDVKSALEEQRTGWGTIIAKRRELDVARENHRDAIEEVAIARSRHLSLLWRMVIAAAVMVFLGQFLASVLLPLRPAGTPIVAPGQLRFLGLSLEPNDSVAFLVDCSGSMAGDRIETLRTELRKAMEGLGKGTPFTIAGFNDGTPDELVLPGGREGLVVMDDRVRPEAIAFVERLGANGGTEPADGLSRILRMDPPPARIVLMTDGEFQDRDALRQAILDFESANPGRKLPKVDTVALWWRGEEPFLRALGERTGGNYSFVGFDPFAPYGFTTVIAVMLAATALGVAFGVFIPFWLEVIHGRRGVASLRASLAGLLREFCHVAHDTQVLLRNAFETCTKCAVNAAGGHQRALAIRAFSVVDRVLGTAEASVSAASGGMPIRPGGALAGEDRRDLSRALDTSFPELSGQVDVVDMQERLKRLADEHSEDLRSLWHHFCVENDRAHTGHLPAWKAEQALKERLDRHCDQSALEFLFQRCDELARKADARERIDRSVEELFGRIADGAVPTCLSARTATTGGAFPRRLASCVWIRPAEGTFPAVGDLVTQVRKSLTAQYQAATAHEDVDDFGIVALGLIHEELPVDLVEDGPRHPDSDVVARARK